MQFENILLSGYALDTYMAVMSIIALAIFIALFFITAGYGKFASKTWGPSINNKVAWVLMECPVFIIMCIMFYYSQKKNIMTTLFFLAFQAHYFQRSFIFPLLIKGRSVMPLSVMLMGALFNTCNGYMQGCCIFFENDYSSDSIFSYHFIIGLMLFAAGMSINIHSDSVIRNLRKPGDTKHYLPNKGFYRFVTSANYFGEIVEWTGFFVMTRSLSGLVFVWWTIANLVPRAHKIYEKYIGEFGNVVLTKKRIIPFVY